MPALDGKKIAFLATDGFEDSELTSPWQAVSDAGGQALLVSPSEGSITGKNGHEATVDQSVSGADAADFDGLVLPGGVVNADDIRMDADAVAFARAFFEAGKPVGVICHGAWILTDADVLRGRTLTSYASLKTDLRNAGATWVDEEVHVDAGLVSSRTPDDLPAFNAKIVEEFAEGEHEEQTA
ncbi:type 1 glutamine amidotransferase domain-containing protein [Ornithinimicrobium humiphilum]|uniref:Protease I n=1 Tax=Ornithinimicrobium humiphilum TaxID=125288 RepID=A0A543KPY4_9MICO|nr:type 1 glutamine amidotransferase domain-containing protein [Ornithinimicrobium humiphilum]TQM97132.1 protease I [Ornithinimicrobium humiphilum]